jgi:hypothetical protein
MDPEFMMMLKDPLALTPNPPSPEPSCPEVDMDPEFVIVLELPILLMDI